MRFFGVHYKAAREYGERSAADFGVPFPSVHDEDGDQVVKALRATAPAADPVRDRRRQVAGRKVGEITSQSQLDAWSTATSACACDDPGADVPAYDDLPDWLRPLRDAPPCTSGPSS